MKQAVKNSYWKHDEVGFINSISQLVNVEWTISRIYRCGWFLLGETFHKNVPVWNSFPAYKLVLNYIHLPTPSSTYLQEYLNTKRG